MKSWWWNIDFLINQCIHFYGKRPGSSYLKKPLQYLVDAPLAAITVLSLGEKVYRFCTSHIAAVFLQNCSSSVMLHGDREWPALFKTSHTCSVGLRSGFWLSRSRTLTMFVLKPFVRSFSCMPEVIVLQTEVTVFLQTASGFPPGFPCIFLHSFYPPSQVPLLHGHSVFEDGPLKAGLRLGHVPSIPPPFRVQSEHDLVAQKGLLSWYIAEIKYTHQYNQEKQPF